MSMPKEATVFSWVHVTRSLALCVCFVSRCLSFCPVSFDHCVVCPSSIYGFWLPLWYMQTLLSMKTTTFKLQKIQWTASMKTHVLLQIINQ